ncbi:MAG: pitrilysin family protein [Porphyromonadaceae bacterium]|nr:pitrilysin family protein [Porphyromonadaceae bacterium]
MSYQTHALPSGLRLIFRPQDGPNVYLGFGVRAGTRDEGRLEYGLAHFLEHMLFKGTKLRSSTQIIERIEGVGGELNAYTSKEETILYCVSPKEYVHRALHLMADIVRNSQFPEEELSKEQAVVIDEIHSYHDSPSELIFDEFENVLFRGHALGHNILGTEVSVARQTRASCRRFLEKYYRPENMVIFCQGTIDVDVLIGACNTYFPEQAQANIATPLLPWQSTIKPKQIVRHRGTCQGHVIMGGYACHMHDERRLEMSVLSNILGGAGMNSRLNLALRERNGIAYHVECSYAAYTDTGLLAIYFGCAKKQVDRAVELVEEELRRLVEEPIEEGELACIKRQIKGQLLVGSDQREQTFLSMGKTYLHYNYVEDLETIFERIDAITSRSLHELSCEYLIPEKMFRLSYL